MITRCLPFGPNIQFHNLTNMDDIVYTYKSAYEQGGVHILVEHPELYYI